MTRRIRQPPESAINATSAGNHHYTLREIPLDHNLLGNRKHKIRVVDQATGGWGHINAAPKSLSLIDYGDRI